MITLRDGVTLQPDALYSIARLERALGRAADVNRTYADYDTQLAMYNAWNRYVQSGYDPRLYPGHSRALHPDDSVHVQGLAWDTDDWRTPGFIDLAAEHGWIRTAASDPTEQHHFEYQRARDTHHGERVEAAPWSKDGYDPDPPTTQEDEDMEAILTRPDGAVVHLVRGSEYHFKSERDYRLYRQEVDLLRKTGAVSAMLPPTWEELPAKTRVQWDTYKRLLQNFGIMEPVEADPPKA